MSPMDPDRIAALRAQYADIGLDEADLQAEPTAQFERWLGEVIELGIPEPNAMVLSTADATGRPSSRHVLLKGVSLEGFVFFTNYGSRKGLEMAANPYASLCFPWFCIGRQVIVTGSVSKVTEVETAAYFRTRPRDSQLGAWASARQSAPVESRESLDDAFAAVRTRFADTAEIAPPPFWGGYRVRPDTVEFWQGRVARMHDRLRYRRIADAEPPWVVERLSP